MPQTVYGFVVRMQCKRLIVHKCCTCAGAYLPVQVTTLSGSERAETEQRLSLQLPSDLAEGFLQIEVARGGFISHAQVPMDNVIIINVADLGMHSTHGTRRIINRVRLKWAQVSACQAELSLCHCMYAGVLHRYFVLSCSPSSTMILKYVMTHVDLLPCSLCWSWIMQRQWQRSCN